MQKDAGGYDEFKAGWPVVLSSMLGIGLGLSPLPLYTIGILARPIGQSFGWGFGQIFFGVTITAVVVPLVSPFVGILADRFGVRRVALTSVFLFSLSFMAFALSTGSLALFYVNWAFVAIFGAGTLPITWTRAVNNYFDVRKGLALGLSLMGTGAFGYFGVWYTALLIDKVGWRGAFIGIGALPLLIALPVAFFAFHDIGQRRQAGADRQAGEAARKAALPGLTAREVFKDWRFWLMGAAFLPIAFTVGGVIPNLTNILKTGAYTPTAAIGLVSIVGVSVIIGRTTGGWLVDRFWAPAVALGLIGIPAAACLMLVHGPLNHGLTTLAVFMIGVAAGAEYDLMAFLVARYFGMKSYGVVYGALYSFFAIGAGFGPPIYGAAFDKHHSYAVPLTFSACAMFIGAASLLILGRYRLYDQRPRSEVIAAAEAIGDTLPI